MIKLILLIFILIFILIIITYRYININIRDFFVSRRKEDFVFALKIQLITEIPDASSYLIYNKEYTALTLPNDNLQLYQREDLPEHRVQLYTMSNRIKYILCFFYYRKVISHEPIVNEFLEKRIDTTIDDTDITSDNNCVYNNSNYTCLQNIHIKHINIDLDPDTPTTHISRLADFQSEFHNNILEQITQLQDNVYKTLTVIQIELQNDIWDYSNLIIEVV